MFPRLGERAAQLAGTLSGGERQMLAIGRALMARPKLLMLDEPSSGLAPIVVREMMEKIQEVSTTLGTTILMVEQNIREAFKIVERVYVLKLGRIVFEDRPDGAHRGRPVAQGVSRLRACEEIGARQPGRGEER